jgi:alanine racemase
VALREVPAGTSVSYGGSLRTIRPTKVATLPVGYADGYTRRMSGRAQVLCGGQRCQVLGPITMDMTLVDVTSVPGVQVGDEVVLLGSQPLVGGSLGQAGAVLTLPELADWAGTIPWEVCCTISKRVPRVYTGEVRL